ncbi:hypothetical protein GH714_040517 [Hevea brasiliensis]|uniref:tRNA nucleotidyltransferase/poly(A) polymerase RNA and SrmB- binding domain-containing protein n=1 Tax=Hevea brasiliensis TaxID=3981 RepID=A0A6A6MGB2_HEVBR|nr:hypothetical protein GH714_040517 [Hevea brasiliensis]
MVPEWKKWNSNEFGISTSTIARPTRKVLNGLRKRGSEGVFVWCEIVGKRFPVCHEHIGDTIVEVSSFSTTGRKFGRELSYNIQSPIECDEKDYVRWRNCLQRDFTINGLMFDPYAKIVYDYMGARILRAVRIAARLGFRFSRETAHFVKNFACSILKLDKGRLLMEMNYMLAYGSAEASLSLLWRFGLLEILLPIQSPFSTLDKLLAPDRPCHSSLCYFCLAVHNGGDMSEALNIARRIAKLHDVSFQELSEPGDRDSEALNDKVMDLAASIKRVLSMMSDEYYVSQAMSEYPQASFSDLVFIPLALYLKVCKIFDCVRQGREKGFVPKQRSKINYELLALGSLEEVRHTFARIVFDTVYPFNLT